MDDTTVDIIAAKSGSPKFAWDSYRRFLREWHGDVVMGVQKRPEEDHEPFESVIEGLKDEKYGNHHFPDTQLNPRFQGTGYPLQGLDRERTGKDFPQVAKDQLWGSIGAVFGSWNN